jgi:hypothetical protein
LPVVGEPLWPPEVYGEDRLFVYLRLDKGDVSELNSDTSDAAMQALEDAGHPVVRLRLHDPYDLGGQFFLWEMATAVAGHRLGINPFDQPNVEAAKVLARQMVAEYIETGVLPRGESAPLTAEALDGFLAQAQPGDYVALQAYVQPTAETDAALLALRTRLRDRFGLATTVGYGPRFLHSTGQLHKGDAGHGLFIQFTADDSQDVPIPDKAGSPDSSITFGVLKAAQALGDWQAVAPGSTFTFTHNLNWDPNLLMVRSECYDTAIGGAGIHQLWAGGDYRTGGFRGAHIQNLTANTVRFVRRANDMECDRARVRVWRRACSFQTSAPPAQGRWGLRKNTVFANR